MRVSKNKLNPHLEKELYNTLHQAISDLRDPEEVKLFFDAFLSDSEHQTLAKRVAVAYWLDKGRGYNNIGTNLKVSSATIAGIQELTRSHKGVRLALSKIKAEEWANIWVEKIRRLTR